MKKRKKYRLLLISPRQKYINYPAHSEMAHIFGKKRLMIPLALPTVAALTPDYYDIRIYDEEIQDIPEKPIPDIVGITTLGATINRAYMLADHYRSMGAKVVLGGPYVSFMTEEALQHADSVVSGEAEGSWEQCLKDFENGIMKPLYKRSEFAPFKTHTLPRWDLVRMNRIFQAGIQVSRGCPFNCEFCLVSKMFGRKMRYRDIGNIVDEIKATPVKYFFFVDDNLTTDKKFAKELMHALIPLKISWGCMCSIDVADDDELLEGMAQAGCFNILIGFESLNPQSLNESNKRHNHSAEIYEEAIRKIHSHGIHINASFIAGFDHDTLDEFDRIFDFTVRMNMPYVNLHLLNAPPGTETFRRYKEEGRLTGNPHEMGVGHFPMIRYMNMSQIEIFDKYMETITRLYSFRTIREKAEHLFAENAFIRSGGKISAAQKARLSWVICKEFPFSRDKDKRELFFFILKQVRNKKLAIDKGMGFLISMLGYNRHIRDHLKHLVEYRDLVMRNDKGPWKNHQPEPSTH
ncbi:MAG: radical SAM protein [Bacteroidota bacterium]|nr:radical SAM protein [Bacteroidota bacterium]